jgi:hypothetical protein
MKCEIEKILVQNHPQTQSFLKLFPVPDLPSSMESRLAQYMRKIWNQKSGHLSDIPAFMGLFAVSPDYNYEAAARGKNDYACDLYAHFDNDLFVLLGNICYPDEKGEFVMGGHRYYIPMFLRTDVQIKQMVERGILARNLTEEDEPEEFQKQEQKGNKKTGLSSKILDRVDEEGFPIDLPELESGRPKKQEEETDSRNTDNLRVVLVGHLLEKRLIGVLRWIIRNVMPEVQVAISRDEETKRPVLNGILQTYFESCLEKTTRRFFLHVAGRLVDMHNPLARLCQRRELSFYGPGGVHPESIGHLLLRDVNEGDRYCICPVQTPQGHSIGLRLYLARRAGVDILNGKLLPPEGPQAGDILGDAASLIPFIEHDDVSRALMGANMMKQALALEKPQVPWVQTGWEKELASHAEVSEPFKARGVLSLGANLLVGYLPWGLDTFEDGIVVSQSAAAALSSIQEEVFWFEEKREWWEGSYGVIEVTRDNPNQMDNHILEKLDDRGIIKLGEEVGPGDVLVSALLKRSKRIHKTQLIDRLVAHAFNQEYEEIRDQSLRLPHNFRGRVTEIIDSAGSGKLSMALVPEVLRRIGVRVRRIEGLAIGDKLTGRHGNKGVVGRILPDWEMPYYKVQENGCENQECRVSEAHRHLQIILNPLGVTSRLNVGQLYETALGKLVEKVGEPYVVRPFKDSWTPERLAQELKQHGFPEDGKEQLYLFTDGSERPLKYRSLVGSQYIIRLHHLAMDKIHGRGSGNPWEYTLRDDQPLGGKRLNGGQRMGEMETWALAGYGAWHILDDFLTVKSDDRRLRNHSNGPSVKWDGKRRPMALVNLVMAVRGLALDMRFWDLEGKDVTQVFLEQPKGLEFSRVTLDLAAPEHLRQWELCGEVRSQRLYAPIQSRRSRKKTLQDSKRESPDRIEDESEPEVDPELWPDREGLFSRVIFERPWNMGNISLAHPIVHPLAARSLWEAFCYPTKFKDRAWDWATQLCDKIQEGAWPEIGEIRDTKERLNYERVKKGLQILQGIDRLPKEYLLTGLPVVPVHFRKERLAVVDNFENDLNLLYRNVIISNSRLKVLIENKAPEPILKNGREKLFQSVDSLFLGTKTLAGLVGILKGKKGLLRGHLAGKRVDFSGRAVIVGDPTIGLDEVHLPKAIWLKVFGHLDSPEDGYRVVLLNRQPSLHRYSIQAFQAFSHDQGEVIRINPYVCRPFNADFDGDTMAIHVPKKSQALNEAEKLFPSVNLFSQANGGLVLGFGGDLSLGVVYLSHHPEIYSHAEVPLTDENVLAIENSDYLEEKTVSGIRTTVGRLLLRRVFKSVAIPNQCLDVQGGAWKEALEKVAHQGSQSIKRFTSELGRLLSQILKNSGLSLSVSDFTNLDEHFNSTLDEEAKKDNPHFLWLSRQAGAKGDLKHLIGPRGGMRRPGTERSSNIIKSGLIRGHSEEEYLLSAHGARAGLVDKGLNTAPAGLLLRALVYKLQKIYILCEDCGTTEGLNLDRGPAHHLIGRYKLDGLRVDPARIVLRGKQEESLFYFRSPFKCKARNSLGEEGICQICYGIDPATGKLPEIGLPVGILAAQAVGERAAQLTLRTFHTGGGTEVTLDLDMLRKKIFRSKVSGDEAASRWIAWMMDRFGHHPDPPRQVHFEIILRGVTEQNSERDLLSEVAFSNVGSNLLYGAASRAEDRLEGVISRIVSGRLLDAVPKENGMTH